MTTRTLDLNKNKTINIPADWKGRAFVMRDDSTIIISKTAPLTFDEISQRVKRANIRITPKEIQREIDAYRREKHANSPRY